MCMIKPKTDLKNDKKEMKKREKTLGKELKKNNIKFPMSMYNFENHTTFFTAYSLQDKTIHFMFSNQNEEGWLVISNGTEKVYASKDDVIDIITKKHLAEKIVNNIRSNEWNENEWNENEEGAGCIDNEIFLANGLLQKMNNTVNNISLEDCKTVEECQIRLTEFSISYLMFMMKFIKYGGTSNDEFFKLRDEKKAKDIKAWFDASPN